MANERKRPGYEHPADPLFAAGYNAGVKATEERLKPLVEAAAKFQGMGRATSVGDQASVLAVYEEELDEVTAYFDGSPEPFVEQEYHEGGATRYLFEALRAYFKALEKNGA